MKLSNTIKVGSWLICCLLLGSFMVLTACGEDKNEVNIPVTSISIQGSFITDGGTSQMTATVFPEDATNKEVEWSVSNELVATIDQTGLLTAVSNGIVTVRAAALDGSEIVGSKSIEVSGITGPQVFVESITIQASNITDGEAQQLSVEVLPSNATNKSVTWSVSDESIATITSEGLLEPQKNGSVTITATSTDGSEISDEKEVTITGVEGPTDGEVVDTATEIVNAISSANPGDKIYIRGGTYVFATTINISRDGEDGNMIQLLAYPSDETRPLFDFSSMSENSSNRGISLSGDYWHIKGIDVYGAGDNGMFIRGNSNLIEFCTFYENADSGLQIGNGGANNTVLNCDSYFNADSSLENADGFAAKLDCGSGNKFIGCRAWNNLDDGWDGYLRGADNVTTYYENCWAVRNGYLKSGAVGAGDGNGFKTGGSDDKDLKHNAEYRNCIAAGNVVDGFDHNSNRGSVIIYNSSAHANGRNISFGTGNIAESLTIKNTLSFDGNSSDQLNATSTDITNNGWQNGRTTNSSDFQSVDIDLLLSPRKSDGSLPDITYLHLVNGSDLIDAGVDVGLPFNGTAPDIGAFEKE